jgi:hypothetical protein
MSIDINEEPMTAVVEYARISIAFEVHAVVEVIADAANPTSFTQSERHVETPYLKDYDAIGQEAPTQ